MIARQHIPNLLTFGRVAAVPLCLLLIASAPTLTWPLFVIFFAAAVSDYYDGMLARKWNVTSELGALLDPIADKLLVALLLIYCVPFFGLSVIAVALIILRELYISGLREFLAGKQIALPVSRGGKWKTATQMAGIGLLLLSGTFDWPSAMQLGKLTLWLAALISVATAVDYTRKSLKLFR